MYIMIKLLLLQVDSSIVTDAIIDVYCYGPFVVIGLNYNVMGSEC
jgi:hypothetical protein